MDSIEYIPDSEDTHSGLTNPDVVGGNPDVVAVSGPESGHLEALLSGMPETGMPAEQENKEKNWQKSDNYRKSGQRWEPTHLNSRHREIMRRLLEGANYQMIATEMGMNAHTISIIATSQMFREELAKLEQVADFEVLKRADALANEALDTLKKEMRSAGKASDRIKASVEILGIGGYSKIEKKMVGVVNGEEVIKRLNEMRRQRIQGEMEAVANGNA